MAKLLVNKARPTLFARVLMRAGSALTLPFPYRRYMASLSRLFKPRQFNQTFVSFIAVDSQNREYVVEFHSGFRGWTLNGNGWSQLCKDNGFTQFDVILIFMYKHIVIEGAPITAVHRLLVVKETGHEEVLNESFCCEKCGTALLATTQL